MRYIVENPDITQLNEIKKKYVSIYNKKDYLYQIRCVLKVLTNTNDIQHPTIKPILNVQYISDSNIILENEPCFALEFEMRVTFISSHKYMTYDNYKKQPMPMCEIKLNQILYKNPELINSLNRCTIYPYIHEYAHFPAPVNFFPQLQLLEPGKYNV